MAATLLRHDVLSDERRWAVVFGSVATVVAILVSFYDAEPESVGSLLALSTLAVAGYWLRLIVPVPVWLLPLLAGVVQVIAPTIDSDVEGHAFLVLLALFFAFFRGPIDPAAGASALPLTVVAFLVTLPLPAVVSLETSDDSWLYWTMGQLVCSWFGYLAYSLRVAVSEIERERASSERQAITEERRRIARDVHDLVGHSLSVMLLHVGAARRAVAATADDDGTDRGEEASPVELMRQAEAVGRRAMTEVRQTIGLLADGSADGRPLPGIGDLDALIDEYREAGLDVRLRRSGNGADGDEGRGVAGYRIVQEALVNATKHAAGSRVDVEAALDDDQWRITVANRGGRASRRPEPTSGRGLIGMAERARSVNGTLVAGPVADGWRVEAVLPRRGS